MLRFLFWVFEVDIWKNIQSALTLTFLTQGTWERVKKSKEEKNRWAVPLLSQFSARTLRKERKREKDGGPEWKNKERWRQWITPNSNEIKQSDTEEQETENRNQPDRKLKQKITSHCFFIVILWFLFSLENTVYLTQTGTEEEDRQTQRGLWVPRAPPATHAMLADYPRCLYSHMRSIWILNSKNMCQPLPICLSPRYASTIAHAQLMKSRRDVPIY